MTNNLVEEYAQWLYNHLLSGTVLGPSGVEAVAATLLCDCFAMAEVSGRHASYFPMDVLQTLAEELVLYGDSVWRVRDGRLDWVGADNYATNKAGQYWVDGRSYTGRLLHVRYRMDRMTGRGVSPLGASPLFKNITRQLDRRAEEEAKIPVAHVMPFPQTGEVPKVDDQGQEIPGETESFLQGLNRRMRKMVGKLYAVTSLRMVSDEPNPQEYNPIRWGPMFHQQTIEASAQVSRVAAAILGLPQALLVQDGSGLREGLRYYLHTTLQPYGERITAAAEQAQLEVNFDFTNIMAADIQGRARAFQSLVPDDEKLTREEAMEIVGFDLEE